MRDEAHDPYTPEILRHRREAFTDGYDQAVGDAQSWMYMHRNDGLTTDRLLELLLHNSDKYREMMEVAPRIDQGIAEAHAGQTVDRGDFTRFLVGEPPQHTYLSTSCLHGNLVLPDGRTGHEYCQSEANPTGPKIPAVCKFCQAPCICLCHKDPE